MGIEDTEIATVIWNTGPALSGTDAIIIFEHINDLWNKIPGPNVSSDSYDINSNFSLIINEVSIEDDGIFYCHVFDKDANRFVKYTKLIVFGKLISFRINWYTNMLNCIIVEERIIALIGGIGLLLGCMVK